MFDYETLRVIWWVLLGVLLMGYAVMDGFDLGVATLLPFIGRTDSERRVLINAIGPVWEGNQVWLVLGGGAVFAAWPFVYAVAFSGFYLAMFLVLVPLILRAVAFTFRSQLSDPRWRETWDWVLFIGGFVPALVFGVALGNVLEGVPFKFDPTLRMTYEGGLFGLLNPFALLAGLTSVAMVVMHGASYLGVKSDGAVAERAATTGRLAAVLLIVLFTLAGLWVAYGIDGYAITQSAGANGPSNPLMKQVTREAGAWLANYGRHPWMILAPALGYLGALGTILTAGRKPGLAFIASGAASAGVVATVGVSTFPFLLPSSLDPAASLTVWDASSSATTLTIMLVATAIFMPLILAYTAWVFRVLRGKVTIAHVESDGHY